MRTYGKNAGERMFPLNYCPEVDVSPKLREILHTHFLQLIGILWWSIELGHVDIITEVSTLSQHQCSPRIGHLEAVYRVFWYLKCTLGKGKEARIVFDPSTPNVDENLFHPTGSDVWEDFYPGTEE